MASRNSDLDPFQGFNIFKPGWKSFGPSVGAYTGSQSQSTPGIMQTQAPPVPAPKPVPKNVGVPLPHPDKVTPEVKGVAPTQSTVPAQPSAPATAWQWQPGQAPQWPIKQQPQGEMPYGVAQHNQIQEWADKPMPNLSDPARLAMNDEHHRAESDLYKQYHGGYGPVTYQSLASQPGVQRVGGASVYRGNAGGFGGESIAERDMRLSRENAAIGIEQQKANAGVLQAQAAMKEAETRDPRLLPKHLIENPQEALLYGAMHGVKPDDLAALRSLNTGPIGPGSYSQRLQAYPDLARVLAEPRLRLHEKLGLLSKTPGAEDPNHPIHQIISSWLQEQMASGDFAKDVEAEYPQRNPYDVAQWLAPTKRSQLAQLTNRFGYQLPNSQ